MRLLLATDNKELDEYIKKNADVEVAGEVYYREAIVDAIRQYKCDTALISIFLSGDRDMLDIIFQARMTDARIILLMNRDDKRIIDIIAMGIYDILFSPISATEIINVIKEPKRFSQILRELNMPWKPESKTLAGFIKSFLQKKSFGPRETQNTVIDDIDKQTNRIDEPQKLQPESAKTSIRPAYEVKNNGEPKSLDLSYNEVQKAAEGTNGNGKKESHENLSRSIFSLIGEMQEEKLPILNKMREPRQKKPKQDKTAEGVAPAANTVLVDCKVRAIAVMGVCERAGSTSFCIALAKLLLEHGYKVRIVDAGGGAAKWIKDGSIECSSEIGVLPGYFTIFDLGHEVINKIPPFTEYVFIITDGSQEANPTKIMPYLPERTYLVGTKGMDEDMIFALADLKMVKALFSLPETSEFIKAEQKGTAVIPKTWKKKMNKILEIIS